DGLDRVPRLFGDHGDRTVLGVEDTISSRALCHTSAFMYRAGIPLDTEASKGIYSGDMLLFSMVAGAGPLVCIPEVMSVYRKHPGGISEEYGRGIDYHRNRLVMLDRLDRFHEYRYRDRVEEVKAVHAQQIARLQAEAGRSGMLRRSLGKVRRLLGGGR
ncbi:MAG: hypothetical protein KDM81_14805, partial [Verrucomicrobiae bacterium]|nr:hypothetical protein [Verrucomicrobiae bacterium]